MPEERDEGHDHGTSFIGDVRKKTELITILIPGLVNRVEERLADHGA